jgi:hypothetical protein
MVARITYRFQPIAGLKEAPKTESGYEFVIFGGDRPDNNVGYELRRWMPMDLFPALRDAESDLARWSRSPLRPLLDRAARTVAAAALKTIAKEVHQTTSKIAALPELDAVVEEVNKQLTAMVGNKHAVETALGFVPTRCRPVVAIAMRGRRPLSHRPHRFSRASVYATDCELTPLARVLLDMRVQQPVPSPHRRPPKRSRQSRHTRSLKRYRNKQYDLQYDFLGRRDEPRTELKASLGMACLGIGGWGDLGV